MLNWFSAELAPLTWNPFSRVPLFTDGESVTSDWNVRAFGSRSNSSAVTLCATVTLLVSISGANSVTWTVCSVPPTVIFASTLRLRPTGRITSGTSYRLNPLSSKETM